MKQTAVNWLIEQIKSDQYQKALSASEWMEVVEKAKQMEIDREYELKAFWFGRGINAGRENKIEELQPKLKT